MLSVGSTFMWFLFVSVCQHLTTGKPYRGQFYDARCTDAETGREFYIGEAFTRPGLCVRLQCLGNLEIWEDRCQVPKLQGDCSVIPPANEFLDYPRCCPLYKCKTYASNENGQTEEIHTYDHYGNLRKTAITQILMITDLAEGKVASEGVKTNFEI